MVGCTYLIISLYYDGVEIYEKLETLVMAVNNAAHHRPLEVANQAYSQGLPASRLQEILPFKKDGYVYTIGNRIETQYNEFMYQICRQKE